MWPYAWPVPGKNGPGVSSATPPGTGSGGGSASGPGSGSGSGSGGGTGRGRGSGGSGHGRDGGHGGGSGCGGGGTGGRCGAGTGDGSTGSGCAGSGHTGFGWLGSSGTSPACTAGARERSAAALGIVPGPAPATRAAAASRQAACTRVRGARFWARAQRGYRRRGARHRPAGPPGWWPRTGPGRAHRADRPGRIPHIETVRRAEQKREERGYVHQELRYLPPPGACDRDVGAAVACRDLRL